MKIQFLNGGLANQVFQYIFVRFAELTNPNDEPWFFDDSFFYVNNIHNGYELEKVFGLKLNLLSKSFDSEVWNEFLANKQQGISIPQTFQNLGFPIIMITEFENFQQHNPFDGQVFRVPGNQFVPAVTTADDENIYYHGYWLHPQWLLSQYQAIKEELTFPPIIDNANVYYANRILATKSIAVHIRRGDYVTLGWASEADYYLQKIKQVLTTNPDATIFLFSDDLAWCREYYEELGLDLPQETIFVEGNVAGRNYIDLQLMSMCQIMILNRSSFGFLAMLLNDRLEYFLIDDSILTKSDLII